VIYDTSFPSRHVCALESFGIDKCFLPDMVFHRLCGSELIDVKAKVSSAFVW